MIDHQLSRKVKELYSSYPYLKIKLDILEPTLVNIPRATKPERYFDHSKVEDYVEKKIDLESKIKQIDKLLTAMTNDERQFIKYCYFDNKPMEIIPDLINWSRRETFRLRQSVIAKTKWLLDLNES